MNTIRTNHVSAGSHIFNETFRLWDGDSLVVYHTDSEDNLGVKGKAGTTRRICNSHYPPHRVMRIKRKYYK